MTALIECGRCGAIAFNVDDFLDRDQLVAAARRDGWVIGFLWARCPECRALTDARQRSKPPGVATRAESER